MRYQSVQHYEDIYLVDSNCKKFDQSDDHWKGGYFIRLQEKLSHVFIEEEKTLNFI